MAIKAKETKGLEEMQGDMERFKRINNDQRLQYEKELKSLKS